MNDPGVNAGESSMSRSRPSHWSIFIALVIVVIIGVASIAFLVSLRNKLGGEKYPKIFFLLAAAILGSLVNQPFRDDEDRSSRSPSLFVLYMAWKSAIAIVFAIIVNLMFISGVISGELFPEFWGTNLSYTDMIRWAITIDLRTNADMAKMLLWSFVAGFSEKVVPNMVSRIFAGSG